VSKTAEEEISGFAKVDETGNDVDGNGIRTDYHEEECPPAATDDVDDQMKEGQ
jgi:hypothetical protein